MPAPPRLRRRISRRRHHSHTTAHGNAVRPDPGAVTSTEIKRSLLHPLIAYLWPPPVGTAWASTAFKARLASVITRVLRPLPLYHYAQLPAHLQDNDCILTGHRAGYDLLDCVRSVAAWHNETLNIWTHLAGGAAFMACVGAIWRAAVGPDNTNQISWVLDADSAVMALYLATVAVCLLCSTLFHTFHCHEERRVFDNMAIADYTGITTLLFGSFTSLVYFAFRPHPHLLPLPLGVTAAASLAGVALPWFPFFRMHKYRALRTLIFAGLCVAIFASVVWAAVAIVHELASGWTWDWVAGVVGVVGCYGGGGVIYVTRFPECLRPGAFDHIGQSHQIWHVLVIGGAYSHWHLLTELRDWRVAQDVVASMAAAAL
ncbi:hemolysin-III related-domain-containing protein [Blastocladiella britannica]|nr:hemolysin-III related-domain-containing protein [Blastocladiella britannica]